MARTWLSMISQMYLLEFRMILLFITVTSTSWNASLVWFAEDQKDCPRCQWALLSSSDNWGKLDQGWNHWQPKTWTAAAWSLVRTWNVDRDDDETLPAHTCHVFVSTIHYFHIPAISSNVFLIMDTSDYFYNFLHTASASFTKHSSSLMKCFLNQGYLQILSPSMSLAGVSVYSDVTNFRRVLSISSLSHVTLMICAFILN